jgi:hypothetical protein
MHWELEKASYPDDDGDGGTDWIEFVKKFVIPGMLILAVLGVVLWSTSGDDMGLGSNIFQDIGSSMFNLGGV